MKKSLRWLSRHKAKVSDKRAKKRLHRWVGDRTTHVSTSRKYRKARWIGD